MQNTALIINEFGEIGIDNLLVKSSVENTLLLENGCVCCSIRGDLSDTISGLFAQSDNGDIPRFDYIIIETTGLAQPGPIVQTIKSDISLNTRCEFDKVNKKKKLSQFKNFKITQNLMKQAKKDCIFLHCLPRGSEVEEKVFFSKQSKVWQQALNRVHVQKSILLYCFGKLR